MKRARIEALLGTPLFGGINQEVVAFLLEEAAVVDVREGDWFFRQGDVGTSAFLLERGNVSVLKSHDGCDHFLRRLDVGDFFGEVALLDFGPRSASIRAEVDCSAIEISAQNLSRAARNDIEQFALIYMNLGRELSRRLRDADERLFRSRFLAPDVSEGYVFAPA